MGKCLFTYESHANKWKTIYQFFFPTKLFFSVLYISKLSNLNGVLVKRRCLVSALLTGKTHQVIHATREKVHMKGSLHRKGKIQTVGLIWNRI